MARQANILSFDEVQRSGRARQSRASLVRAQATRTDASAQYSAARQADPYGGLMRPRYDGRSLTSSTSASRRNVRVVTRSTAASRYAGGMGTFDAGFRDERPRASRRSQDVFHETPRRQDTAQEDSAEEVPEEHLSRFAARKKARAKRKAEQKFAKQFGGSSAPSDAAAGPRAAVYKGEMGATHRRASRMQGSATQASTKRSFSGLSLEVLARSPKVIASLIVVACLALSCMFLYPSAQQYYQSVRERDRLAVEYAALTERNAEIESSVASLQTDAGVENQARDQLGWVKEGEQKGSVQGLDSSSDTTPDINANIASSSIKAPETWYSSFLDPLFGVE